MLNSSITRIALLAVLCCGLPNQAQAGPLIDWLFGRYRTQPAYPVGPGVPMGGYGANYAAYGVNNGYNPAPTAGYGGYANGAANTAPGYSQNGYAANYGTYYGSNLPVIGPSGAGYQPPMTSGITAATAPSPLPQTLSYVPNFNTYANRAPVTYYRPLLTTDPNTGAQVVAMAPCTSYEYQSQRVPAFGRSALYGANTPPSIAPAPQALPTYTLPSGGIPLAAGTQSVVLPTVRGYAPYGAAPYGAAPYATNMYSTLQPPNPALVGPSGSYPTQSLGSPYYDTAPCGSSGNSYAPSGGYPVPGLIAPQGTGYPGTGYPGTGYPGTGAPASPTPGVYPGAPSGDPADSPPSLSPNFPANAQAAPRAQLRSIVRQPMSNADSTTVSNAPERLETPVLMKPIPVPEGFEQPRWNPGLLNEDDVTAMRSVAPERFNVAGQSKQIHWASFEQEARAAHKPDSAAGDRAQPQSGLRPIQPRFPAFSPPSQGSQNSVPTSNRYDTSGWEVAK